MFTNFNIQVSHTFTIIGLIAVSTLKFISDTRSKIFGNRILETKLLPNLVFVLSTICNFQQLAFQWILKLNSNDFFNLFLQLSSNSSKEEFLALQNLCKNKNMVIQKSDKVNSVVIVDKADHSDTMENLLNEVRKFEKII